MSISDLFIRRRVGTCLLALGVLMLGAVAYFSLPVAPLPQIDFPTIEVEAQVPGASADTMANTVATPLENSLSSVSGVTQMTSSSSSGRTTIVMQFDLSRDINAAAQDVQAAISATSGSLPKSMTSPPTYHKVNPAEATLLTLSLSSDLMATTELDHYAEDVIAQQLSQMTGVGLVDFHGPQRPSVRIRLDPDKVAARGLTLEDVRSVIGQQTVNAPKGSLSGDGRTVVLDATDQLVDVPAYQGMVVAYRNGAPILLGDLGTVLTAPQDTHQAAWLQGARSVMIDIHKQAGYNVLSTIQSIKDRLPALSQSLPASVKLTVVGDRTQIIEASVADVQYTMLITIALVVGVIFVFLRNFWATVIPSITIPLSLFGTFCVMYLLGYSLDNLSLMGLVIAVGFVVDDAIVVIENITRHLEMGKSKITAAIDGAREVTFTIISMTISLIAVFIPILLMGGVVGRLFREFAVTVSIAILISGVVSLTVTPMLCAWLIKPDHDRQHGRFHRWSERGFQAVTNGYARCLDVVLAHRTLMLLVTVGTLALTLWLYTITPKGFLPEQDTGYIQGQAQAATDISFEAMSTKMQQLGAIVQKDPDVDNVGFWINPSPSVSVGQIQVNLKPFGQRKASARQVMARLKSASANIEGLTLNMRIRQDIQIGGRQGAAQYQYTLQSGDTADLDKWATIMKKAIAALPGLLDVSSDAQPAATSATLDIDRPTAARLGVSVQAIDDVLYDAFGQRQVATLFTQVSQYHVVLELDPSFQLNTDALTRLYVRSSTTQKLIPLSMLASVKNGVLPVTINHQGSLPATTLSFNLAPGVSLSDAVTAIHAAEINAGMPVSVTGSFQGTAQAFQDSLASQPWLILAAVIAVYIVLGVLYESAIHPLTIISTLPSAGLGALLALLLFGQDLSIMGMIGIILLIGIVKKNAIMMIDFALEAEREQMLSPTESIRQACLMRFRPIMMTTLAALLGALPLALGHGPGAELRVPLGIAIVGGLVISQILTLFTTPVIYLTFDRFAGRRGKPAPKAAPNLPEVVGIGSKPTG
ncbi:efflux RND transporter permease subunit (plasmid) [Mesorhizobium sp. AR02]|uniref:efflux RND transporter permease subunit n=1 Tax=Mesorhizobium sp. AR02 TaxID=2865837 RepID=UPI00215F81DD|nr:efflux RND transporter permease subunit [Mesorhizobium sp. AR02]UVK57530.1 efflux RND transporter permease subunit [Mesorhizobium sp. AR02]